MARTKLRQLEQVQNSQNYNDAYAGASTQAVAEPAANTQNIEYDLNILRTLMKDVKGAYFPKWYDAYDGYSLSDAYDGYVSLHNVTQFTLGSLGTMVDSTGAWNGFSGTNYLNSALTTTFAFTTLDSQIAAAAAAASTSNAEDGYIRTFIGKNAAGSETPDYTARYDSIPGAGIIGNNDDLELAIAKLDDGYQYLLAASSAATLQTAYDNGSPAGTDIQVDANDVLNFVLGTGTSAFSVTANAASGSNPVLSVSNDEIRMTSGGSPVPTVVIADGYVLIDGYLSVTGSTLQINTVVTDADHWLVQPALSSTSALVVKPQVTAALYTADLLDLYTGSDRTIPAIQVVSDGKMVIGDAYGNFQIAGHNAADGYYLRSDGSGNASWSAVTPDIGVIAGQTKIVGNTIGIADAFNKVDFSSITATSSGAIALTANTGGVTLNTATSGDIVLNSVGSIDAYGGASSQFFTFGNLLLQSADAYTYLYGQTGIDVYAGLGELTLRDTRSNPTLSSSMGFRLSSSTTGGADFSSTIRTSAAALGYLSAGATGELGIIDAINTLASSSGSGLEKSIFVIGASDARLSGGGKILALAAPDRGSLELTPAPDGYGSGFRPARDLEVYVNGALMLADATQKTSGTAATDDYYLATDLIELNFAFALVQGDVVTIKNNKPAPGEIVDGYWALVQ